jgi:hypothetical protein
MSKATEESMTKPAGLSALWFGLVGGPLIMFIHSAIAFTMLPWACGAGMQSALWVNAAVASVACGAAIFACYRKWLDAGAEWDNTQEAGPIPRGRFMAIVGMAVSGMSLLVIIANFIATLFLGACQ